MLISAPAKQIYYSYDSGRTFSGPISIPFSPSRIEYCNGNRSAYVLGYDRSTQSVILIYYSLNPKMR